MGSGTAHGIWFTDDVVMKTAFEGTHGKPRSKSLENYVEKNEKKYRKKER